MTDTTQRTKHLAKYPVAGLQAIAAPSNEIRLTRHPVKRAFSMLGSIAVTLFVGGFWYFMVRVTPPGLYPIVIITSVIGGLILLTQVAFLHRELSIRSIRVVDGRVQRITSTLGLKYKRTYTLETKFVLVRYRVPSSQTYSEADIETILLARSGRRTRQVTSDRVCDNLHGVIEFLKNQPGINARNATARRPVRD